MASSRQLTHRLLAQGGVSLQRISWTPVEGNQYTDDESLLALSLELLLDFYTPGRIETLLSDSWPETASPFMIVGDAIISELSFPDELKFRLNELNTNTTVDILINTLRIDSSNLHDTPNDTPNDIVAQDSKASRTGSDNPKKRSLFNTVQISSGIVIGSRQVSLGIVFNDADNRKEELSTRLKWMARQMLHDQAMVLPMVKHQKRRPDLARALVNVQTGDIIWRNRLARIGWNDRGEFINQLTSPRESSKEQNSSIEASGEISKILALITFLRADEQTDRSKPLSTQTAVSKNSMEGPQRNPDQTPTERAQEFVQRRLKGLVNEASISQLSDRKEGFSSTPTVGAENTTVVNSNEESQLAMRIVRARLYEPDLTEENVVAEEVENVDPAENNLTCPADTSEADKRNSANTSNETELGEEDIL